MFLDLHNSISQLNSSSVEDRAKEFRERFSGIFIVAFGGVPIRRRLYQSDEHTLYLGSSIALIDEIEILNYLQEALGLSASLTYMNKSDLSLSKLGDLCAEKAHDWAYNWITFSILFSNVSLETELAFTRDSNFYMSWVVGHADQCDTKIFIANGSLKSWLKFLKNKDGEDFSAVVRNDLTKTYELFKRVLP